MFNRFSALVVAAATMAFTGSGYAAQGLYAELSNGAETTTINPTLTNGTTPRPASFGSANFLINDAQTSMTFTATIFNIDFTGSQTADTNDNLTNAHIHASPTVTPTTNGGVVWGFIGSPLNDNNPNDVVVTPFTSGVGGTVSGKWDAPEGNNTTFAAQLANVLNGHSYINFHTNQFGGGEIRGNILVPEPSSAALLGLGTAAAGLRRRRAAVAAR
jgi:hypothetical protein